METNQKNELIERLLNQKFKGARFGFGITTGTSDSTNGGTPPPPPVCFTPSKCTTDCQSICNGDNCSLRDVPRDPQPEPEPTPGGPIYA